MLYWKKGPLKAEPSVDPILVKSTEEEDFIKH
jgi:hypothetical protein